MTSSSKYSRELWDRSADEHTPIDEKFFPHKWGADEIHKDRFKFEPTLLFYKIDKQSQSPHGKDVPSAFPEEAEWLIPHGMQFRVEFTARAAHHVTFYHNTEKKMMNIHFHRVELVNDLGIPSLPDVGSETSESAESSSDIEEGQ